MASLLRFAPLVTALAIPFTGGLLGSRITKDSVSGWYKTIKRAPWTPPNAAFPVAWTYLYLTMGYASYLVFSKGAGLGSTPLMLYGAQLALNFLWTPLFFGWNKLGWALADIVAMEGLIVVTGFSFYRIDRLAGYLFVPYAAWVAYATTLNAYAWYHNEYKKSPSIEEKKE